MSETHPTVKDRGEATMWLAIATPIVMIACLALIIAIWIMTNVIVALVAFGVLCAAAWLVVTKMRQRTRGF